MQNLLFLCKPPSLRDAPFVKGGFGRAVCDTSPVEGGGGVVIDEWVVVMATTSMVRI